jgi:hypothetical protein
VITRANICSPAGIAWSLLARAGWFLAHLRRVAAPANGRGPMIPICDDQEAAGPARAQATRRACLCRAKSGVLL